MHAHTAMYCPVTHNCPLGSKMKISIVIHHHHLIVLSHTYRHTQIPESKQHLQHLATQSFDLGSHPSHSEKKNVTVICLHSCIVCSPKQTSQGAWAFWKKKTHQKNKLYKVSTCCTCCCNFIVYTHAPLSSSLALSYLHGTPLFFLCGLSLCPSPILKFLCVCVCACIPLCKRVYLYVGHLVAIRVNHPSFLQLAVSHKLTWTHTMRHTQLLLEHDSALDGVGKKYWQPSRGQNGGGDGTRKGRMKDRQREGMKVEKQEERFQDVWNGLSHKNRRTW